MRRILNILSLSVLTLSLVNCSHLYGSKGLIKDRDNDYLTAQSIAPLKVPAGYSSQGFFSEYPVADKNYADRSAKVDLTPPGLRAK